MTNVPTSPRETAARIAEEMLICTIRSPYRREALPKLLDMLDWISWERNITAEDEPTLIIALMMHTVLDTKEVAMSRAVKSRYLRCLYNALKPVEVIENSQGNYDLAKEIAQSASYALMCAYELRIER